jgi:hypothetical protein
MPMEAQSCSSCVFWKQAAYALIGRLCQHWAVIIAIKARQAYVTPALPEFIFLSPVLHRLTTRGFG